MKRRFFTILLVTSICLSLLPVSASARTRTILAMGDSISAGYGLADSDSECFVSILGKQGYTAVNKAVSGNRAPDIWDQLNNTANENYISPDLIRSADVITITCGGNDMMDVLYAKTAEIWNSDPNNDPIEADEITSMFADGMTLEALGLVKIALDLLDSDNKDSYLINSPEFEESLNNYISSLNQISSYIHNINPLTEIIVATQYNPYVEFEGKVFEKSILIFSISLDLDPLYSGIEDGATKLNNAIKQNAETGEYSVTDVKQAFDDYSGEEDLYNANPSVSDIEVDFHPTAAGHRLIAECFLETMEAPRYLKITDATGEVHVIELPLDTDVTVVAVGYRDGGAMNDLAIRICSGRNHSVVFSGSKIKVFFLNTGTLIPVKPGITIK